MTEPIGRVLIFGGRGALGAQCVTNFKSNLYWVASIDLHENTEADHNIIVNKDLPLPQQEDELLGKVSAALEGQQLDGIFCVAGGWMGGNTKKDLTKTTELMWHQSVCSSLFSAAIASRFLREGGVLQLTGAKAALDATPGMIGYGLAKAAVHQLTKSLAASGSGLPENSTVVTILPITLDTPMNRKWMPNADFGTWTPLEFVADLFLKWANRVSRPHSGSLLQLVTNRNVTELVPVK